jgi:hypothetical protein
VPTAFPIAALAIVPAMPPSAAVVDIVAAARIIKAVIPAIIAWLVIARTPIITVIAAAIIAAANAHAAIIAIVITATAQGDHADKANGSQEMFSGPRHRLSPNTPVDRRITRAV